MAIIRTLENQGLRTYLPVPEGNACGHFFPTDAFAYGAARDVDLCSNGTTLTFSRPMTSTRVIFHRAPATTCAACALCERCTASKGGRSVARSYDEEYLDRVRAYRDTPPYKRALLTAATQNLTRLPNRRD